MVRKRSLAEVMDEHAGFDPEWSVTREVIDGDMVVTGIEHPRYGGIGRIVICDEDGDPLWEQYAMSSGPATNDGSRDRVSGGVTVPYTVDESRLHLGLVEQERPVPEVPDDADNMFLEFPRGFTEPEEDTMEGAHRELEEELGYQVEEMEYLGEVNPDTSVYETAVPVYAAQVDPTAESDLTPDEDECIMGSAFIPYEDIRQMAGDKITCGLTLAALAQFPADRYCPR